MKSFFSRLFGILLLGVVLTGAASSRSGAQNISVSFQTFYDNLSPYGQWVYDPDYGDVWVPNEGGDFRPYGSRGNWVMTEYGNTWVSDDPWGWAVYHYGRWTYNPYYGWIWVPGYEWAPAWVTWRFGGGYSGWAPLGPNIGVGISWAPPISWWVFVNPTYMYQPNCINYWRGPSYNNVYINKTTIINNYFVDNTTRVRYNYGPRQEVIQRVTNQPVQVYRVSQLTRPGAPSVGRNTVSLYRPTVNQSTVRDARPQNRIEAPRPIGRVVQAAPAPGGGREQPQFRQELPRLQQAAGGRGGDFQPGNRQQVGRPADQLNQRGPERIGNDRMQRDQPQRDQMTRDRQPQMQQGRDIQTRDRDQQMQQQRDQQMQLQRDRQVQQQRDQQMQQQRDRDMQMQRDRQVQQQRDQQMQQQRDRDMQMQRDRQIQQQRDQQMQQQRDQQMQMQRDRQMQQQRDQQMQMQRDRQMQQQRDQQMQMQRDRQMQQQRDVQMQQQREQQRQAPQQPQPQPGMRGGAGGRR